MNVSVPHRASAKFLFFFEYRLVSNLHYSSHFSDVTLDNVDNIITSNLFDITEGNYIYPTLIEETDLNADIWKKELFGPILTIHPYDDEDLEKTAKVCVEISGTNLTGSVFYNDEKYEDIIDTYFKNSGFREIPLMLFNP